ncbi:hypothetical protein [Streptomyces sp. NPDC056549]|uniref:hypothetical protein n=1 Tax=Streptomyces sp. NPDC056549 TaxID=3345864 RepID=UPI003673875F
MRRTEHLLIPDGLGDLPVFLDPGLRHGPAHADATKLVSLTLLALIAAPWPTGPTADHDGANAVIQDQLRPMDRALRGLYLQRLVVPWLMDTTNITTTCLSAAAGLALPDHASPLIQHPAAVYTLLGRVSALLMADADAAAAWRLALSRLAKAAVR